LARTKNFLTDRQQCTRVGDVISDTVKIISGGSCLGPIIFVLYINSITKVLPESYMSAVRRWCRMTISASVSSDFMALYKCCYYYYYYYVNVYTILKSDGDTANL